jgi:alpha-galactosidase
MDASGRDIALSFSAGMRPEDVEDYRPSTQTRRTTGDLIDTWFSVRAKFRSQRAFQKLSGPGGWNDPDMLVVGHVGPGWSAPLQPARLSPTEQYFHLSMWAMLNAPLLIGADLTKLDDFTLALLTNAELIDIHQDALGRQARLVSANDADGTEVWSRPLSNGDRAVALVNVGDAPRTVSATLASLGLHRPQALRDVWRQTDQGDCRDAVEADVPPHGVRVLRVREVG